MKYRLFVQSMYDRSVGYYDAYGVAVTENGEIKRIIRDVSLDRHKVEALIDRFNQERLEPEHLSQAVEEFLYDFEA